MKMEIPLYLAGQVCGCARLWDEGLYRVAEAELAPCRSLLRLYLSFAGQIMPVGVLVPEGAVLSCRRRFSRRSLPPCVPDYAVACADGQWEPDGPYWRRWLPEGWELAQPYAVGAPLQLCCGIGQIRMQTVAKQRCLIYCGTYPVSR